MNLRNSENILTAEDCKYEHMRLLMVSFSTVKTTKTQQIPVLHTGAMATEERTSPLPIVTFGSSSPQRHSRPKVVLRPIRVLHLHRLLDAFISFHHHYLKILTCFLIGCLTWSSRLCSALWSLGSSVLFTCERKSSNPLVSLFLLATDANQSSANTRSNRLTVCLQSDQMNDDDDVRESGAQWWCHHPAPPGGGAPQGGGGTLPPALQVGQQQPQSSTLF